MRGLSIWSLLCLFNSLPRQGNSVELYLDKEKACLPQNITITCVAVNSSDITFIVPENITILQSDIAVLNATVAMTTLPVRHLEEYIDPEMPFLDFICHDSGGDFDDNFLLIYDDPEPVSDFSCVVADWDVSMICTWSQTLAEEDTRNISVKWMDVYGCEEKSCASQSDNSCTINRDFSIRTVSIVVTTSSGCGINLTQCFTVNTKTVVKPIGVVNITSQAINSTCVKVTWKVKKPIQLFKQFFKISYQSFNRPSEIQNLDNIKVTHAEICNLHPGTKYKLEVRSRPVTEHRTGSSVKCGHCRHLGLECECLYGEGYWSNPESDTVTTYTDVPRVSPRVEEGSWAWNPRECNNADSFRDVTIYWQPLEEQDKNGDLISYIVNFTGILSQVQTKHIDPGRTWVTEKIRCNEPYTVTVQARNVNGSSPIQQYISISASQKGVHPPEAVVEMSKTSAVVHVTWKPVHKTDIDHFSVFWCQKDNGECAIYSTIQWKASNLTTVKFMKLNSPESYMFGVSMATEAGNSGITWTRCIYTKESIPRAPSNVKAEAGIQDNALFVTWSALPCESGQPYVDRYNVAYCHDNHCRFTTTRNSSVFVQDLKSGLPYSVQVQGITKDNRTGDWSESIEATPIDKRLSTEMIAALAVAGAVGAVILTVFAVFCRPGLRKLKAKFSPPPIEDVKIDHSVTNIMIDTAEEVEPLGEGSDSGPHEKVYKSPQLISQFSNESGFVEGLDNDEDNIIDGTVNNVETNKDNDQVNNMSDTVDKLEKSKNPLPQRACNATASDYVHISILDDQSESSDRGTQHTEETTGSAESSLQSDRDDQSESSDMGTQHTEETTGSVEPELQSDRDDQSIASDRGTHHAEGKLQDKTDCTEKTAAELLKGLCEENIDIPVLDNQVEAPDNGTKCNENEIQNKNECNVMDVSGYVKSTELSESNVSTTELAPASSEAVSSMAPDRCKSVKAESVNCGYITQVQAETMGNAEAASKKDCKAGPNCDDTEASQVANTDYIPHDLALSVAVGIEGHMTKTDQLPDRSGYVQSQVAKWNMGVCRVEGKQTDTDSTVKPLETEQQ